MNKKHDLAQAKALEARKKKAKEDDTARKTAHYWQIVHQFSAIEAKNISRAFRNNSTRETMVLMSYRYGQQKKKQDRQESLNDAHKLRADCYQKDRIIAALLDKIEGK